MKQWTLLGYLMPDFTKPFSFNAAERKLLWRPSLWLGLLENAALRQQQEAA